MQDDTHARSSRSENPEIRSDASAPTPRIHAVHWRSPGGELEPLPGLAERLNTMGFIPRKGDTLDTDEDRNRVVDVVLNLSADPDLGPFGTVSVILG